MPDTISPISGISPGAVSGPTREEELIRVSWRSTGQRLVVSGGMWNRAAKVAADSRGYKRLSVRFSGGLSSRERLPGKGPDSPAHAHQRC